jgi:hypothetical protein
VKLTMTKLFKLEADGVVYWVSAKHLEDAVLVVRDCDGAGDPDFVPELGFAVTRAQAEQEEVTTDNGDARMKTLLELFEADSSRRVVACSEWA